MAADAVAGTLVKIKLLDGREVSANVDQSVVALLSSSDPQVRSDVQQAIINTVSTPDDNSQSENSQSEVSTQPENNTSTLTDQLEDKKVWSEQEAKALVRLGVDMEGDFNKAKVHKRLWQTIANKMGDLSHSVTAEQCANKWKSIKRSYKEAIDHNERTGETKKFCKFYDELNALYGMKDGTRPQITMGSMPSTIHKRNSDSDSDTDSHHSTSLPPRTPARKIRKKAQSPTVKWLEEYAERQAEAQEKRENLAKEMHDDKMKRFDRLLGILESQNP